MMSERMQLGWQAYQRWWRERSNVEQWGWVSLAVATLLGAGLRLVNLAASLQFQADQGRDALVAYGILQGDIALLGPSTSVGDMYLGPAYYYFMAPFLALFGNSPVGPAFAVAVIGIATIPLLFWIVRRWFGTVVATWSVLLYTSAPWVIEYTRFSWNPNPAPAVSLLLWWSAWQALQGRARWWVAVGFFSAILMQLHYVALLAIAPVGLWWLGALVVQIRRRQWPQLRGQVLWSTVGAGIVIASLAPLLVFDLRFDGIIRQGFVGFFQDSSTSASAPLDRVNSIWREQEGRALYAFGEFWGRKDSFPAYRTVVRALLAVGIAIWVTWGVRLRRQGKFGVWLYVSSILWISILGLAWYRGVVYAHYITFLFPLVPVLVAGILHQLSGQMVGKVLAAGLFTFCLLGAMLPSSQRFYRPLSWQYSDMKAIAQRVLTEIPPDATYALTLLSEVRDYRGMNYRYFLVTSDRPPVDLEISHQADYLVVIAESPDDPTNVLGSPVYEIVNFPKGEYRVVQPERGPKLYIIESHQNAAGVSEESSP